MYRANIQGKVMGHTTHGYIVYLEGDIDVLQGKLVNVKIEECRRYDIIWWEKLQMK